MNGKKERKIKYSLLFLAFIYIEQGQIYSTLRRSIGDHLGDNDNDDYDDGERNNNRRRVYMHAACMQASFLPSFSAEAKEK